MRLNNATIKQVIVSPATLGERLRLCGIRPYNEYINGNRTDTVLGYTYTVTCSGFQGERLDVKIPGKQLLGEDAYDHLVKFTNIQLGIYPSFVKGQRGIDAAQFCPHWIHEQRGRSPLLGAKRKVRQCRYTDVSLHGLSRVRMGRQTA